MEGNVCRGGDRQIGVYIPEHQGIEPVPLCDKIRNENHRDHNYHESDQQAAYRINVTLKAAFLLKCVQAFRHTPYICLIPREMADGPPFP